MLRALHASLSSDEELTLCRVAIGIALTKDLPAADVLRLRNLALVEDRGERLELTAIGRIRYDALPKAPPAHASQTIQQGSFASSGGESHAPVGGDE